MKLDEYPFEIRNAQPGDHLRKRGTDYWRRVMAALDKIGPGASLFFRCSAEAPVLDDLSRMRNNLRTQLKRYRPGETWEIARSMEDGGVYVYRQEVQPGRLGDLHSEDRSLSPVQATDDDAQSDDARGPHRSIVETDAERRPIDERTDEGPVAQRQSAEPVATEDASEDASKDPALITGTEVAGPTPAGPIPDPTAYEGNMRGIKNPCQCPDWWKNSRAALNGSSRAKGPHHHETCPLFSTWKDHPDLETCSCPDVFQSLSKDRLGGRDTWYEPGFWHDPSCPRHRHKFVLPGAGEMTGQTLVGRCWCGATKDHEPLSTSGVLNKPATSGPAARPAPTPEPPSSARCPDCGAGWSSFKHKQHRAADLAAQAKEGVAN